MTSVVVVDEAEQQLREIVDWWIANRPAAPTLALDEFERCVTRGRDHGAAPVRPDVERG